MEFPLHWWPVHSAVARVTAAAGVLSVLWLLPIGARGSLVFRPPTGRVDGRATFQVADGTGLIDVETGVVALAGDSRRLNATGALAAIDAFHGLSPDRDDHLPYAPYLGSTWWPTGGTVSGPGGSGRPAAVRRNWTDWFTSHAFGVNRNWELGRSAGHLPALGGDWWQPPSAPPVGSMSFALSVGSEPGMGGAHPAVFGRQEAGPDRLLAGVRMGSGGSSRAGGNGRPEAGSADLTLDGAALSEPPAWLRWALDLLAEFGVLGSAIGMAMAAFLIKFIAALTTR